MEISAQTKVNDLLQAFPHLEGVLISLNPQFKKLRNPLLRNSVGRIATLKQAALVADIPPLTFINHLRRAVGQDAMDEIAD
ncbi:MAG: DUF1858 domain-containing protein [Leptolyngbyaceae cyanobacterium MO_188.B28]|nr:DUF1858 domain-containing protein [Leptolyngbyaceae cyanobacterium MO_188.B28]